jgi:hypothetical protein
MVNHPDRRDHRIQREDGIQHHDLQYHHPETGIAFTVTGIVLAVFQPFMQLGRRLKQQEYPAEQHDEIAPGKGEIGDSNSGFVSVTIQEMTDSSPRRITSASDRPIRRALSRCFGGSLSARMAINTRLSIPSTISRTISVNRPAQIEGSIKNSMTTPVNGKVSHRHVMHGRDNRC